MHMNSHSTHSHTQAEPESPSAPNSDGSTRCDCCKSCGAILELDGCGHRFHPRCIYTYPITQCELCSTPVTTVKIFRPFKNSQNTMTRKGKWSGDEHKYANMMMKQFQMGAMPLVDGLHLRGFIANLLQCDPLRVTKKYSGHAIGKQNFYYQRNKSYCYNLHTKMQKRISSLRNHYYWHIQYRCKFGYSTNIQELKLAEADYWIREFLKFANKTGQRVEMAAVPMEIESPVPSPMKEPLSPASPVQLMAPLGLAVQPIVKTEEVEQVPPPVAQSPPQIALSVNVAETETLHDVSDEPSFKLPGASSSSSPLSFDEWREEEAPSFIDMLDKTLLTDFTKQQSQFSTTLGDMLDPLNKSIASSTASSSQSSNTRCSLKDWLNEEESRWNESMAVTSWSFSLTLSEV